MKLGDVMNSGHVAGGKIYGGGNKRHALRDQQGTQEDPAAFTSAKEFKQRFEPGTLERRLLGFEKSYRHDDDWQHMPYQLNNEHTITTGYGHQVPHKDLPGIGFDKSRLHPKGSQLKSRHEFKNLRIPESQAQQWFLEDVSKAKQDAIRIAGQHKVDFNTLPPQSQQALAEMAFQMGPTSLSKFKGMWKGYKDGDLGRVQEEMLDSNWARSQTPKRAESVTSLLDEINPEEFPAQRELQAGLGS